MATKGQSIGTQIVEGFGRKFESIEEVYEVYVENRERKMGALAIKD